MFCFNFAYSAAEKPKTSVEKIDMKISLSALTQLLLMLPIP